jgi:hypothetical protein
VTSIREQIRRYLRGSEEDDARRYSLKVHWINEVRNWDDFKRQSVASELGRTLDEVKPTDHLQLDEIDEQMHTGESLSILRNVLHIFSDQVESMGVHHER